MAAEPLHNLPAEADDDPFRYGWRLQRVRLPNGEEDVVEVPLTVEDLLDPQLEDKVPQSGPHFSAALLLAATLLSEPDSEGRILSETTQLLFGVGEDGETPWIFDARTGQRLLTLGETDEALRAIDAENARLREEIERLRKGSV
jgi:hypothetical protein